MGRRTALTSAKSFLCDHSLPFVWVKIDIHSTINRAKPLCFSLMQAVFTQCPLMCAIDHDMLKFLQFNTDPESLHGFGSPQLHPWEGKKAEGAFCTHIKTMSYPGKKSIPCVKGGSRFT